MTINTRIDDCFANFKSPSRRWCSHVELHPHERPGVRSAMSITGADRGWTPSHSSFAP